MARLGLVRGVPNIVWVCRVEQLGGAAWNGIIGPVSVRTISTEERRSRLMRRHRLHEMTKTDDVATIARDLVGLHSSDPTTVYLSAAARMNKPSTEAVDAALYVERSLVRHHAMRKTLWVHPPDLAEVAHAATTQRYAATEEKRLLKMLDEWSPVENGRSWLRSARIDVISALGETPGLSTRKLGSLLPQLKVPIHMAPGKSYSATQSALARLLPQLGFEAIVVRREPTGSWINSQYRWNLMTQWLEDWMPREPADARVELVAAWLDSFGPGTLLDISWWTGLPKGMIRQALLAAGAIEVDLDGDQLRRSRRSRRGISARQPVGCGFARA